VTKRPDEIALLAQSGKLLADVFGYLDRLSLIGMSTMQVNDLVDAFIVNELNARPASKGQYGYAYALNSSPNNVVCHGVPSTKDILQNGDIVNFDITLETNDYIADSSKHILLVRSRRWRNGSCEWPTKPCGKESRPFVRAPPWGMLGSRSSGMHGIMATRSSGNIAGTALGVKCTSFPKCCIGENRKRVWCCRKEWCSPSSRCSTKGSGLCGPNKMAGRSSRAMGNYPRNLSTL